MCVQETLGFSSQDVFFYIYPGTETCFLFHVLTHTRFETTPCSGQEEAGEGSGGEGRGVAGLWRVRVLVPSSINVWPEARQHSLSNHDEVNGTVRVHRFGC